MEPRVRVRHRTRPSTATTPSGADGASAPKSQPSGDPGDYEVGYKKPPGRTRFKKGQSGNPKGRPKGPKNLTTLIDRELNSKVIVREGGARQELSKREVVAKQLIKKALGGEDRSIATLIKLDEQLEAEFRANKAAGADAPPNAPLAENDHAILAALEAQLVEKHGQASGQAGDRAAGDANETEEVGQ